MRVCVFYGYIYACMYICIYVLLLQYECNVYIPLYNECVCNVCNVCMYVCNVCVYV